MRRTLRDPNRNQGRCHPRLERLEHRLVLSASVTNNLLATVALQPFSSFDKTVAPPLGPDLSVIATDPAEGASVSTLSTVSVTFDRPLDSSSYTSQDLIIQRLEKGIWASAFDPLATPSESLDATATRLILTLPRQLSPGQYRLMLPQGSFLMGMDGSSVLDLGHDQVLGQFSVVQPGVKLSDARNLGSLGPASINTAGALNFSANPGAVVLYKFTLPEGHYWRFGAEVSAQREGSPLRSGLALFDAQGHPLATANTGRPGAPSDPYLFHGLEAGTYYVGISGNGNLPGLDHGYDPVTGRLGSVTQSQTGGAFHLNLVADPADAPVQLLEFSLSHADPLASYPTGFTLGFSGLLDLSTFRGDPSPGIEVVNQNGTKFPVTAIGYHEEGGHYYFLFNQEVPAGHYEVRLPGNGQGGLKDLAGLTPVATGQPSGVLASFDVDEKMTPRDPNDLGPFYHEIHDGISRSDLILPGRGVTYRFVATAEGLYHLETQYTGGSLSIQTLGPNVFGQRDGGEPGKSRKNDFYLKPGVYYLQFVNNGTTPSSLTWTLRVKESWDSLLDNAVGQGPALNLRLINPTAPDMMPAADSSFSGPQRSIPSGPSSPGENFTGTPASTPTPGHDPGRAAGGSNLTLTPGGLALTLGNTLVGRPSSQSDHITPVGPGPLANSLALNSASGLPRGLITASSQERAVFNERSRRDLDANGLPINPVPRDGALVTDRTQNDPRPDEIVIAASEWLTWAGNAAAGWLSFAHGEQTAPRDPASLAEPIVMTRDDSPLAAEPDRVERAEFGIPLAVGVCSLMAMRYNHPARHWFRRNRSLDLGPTPNAARGPHRRF
ncbi:MAG: hypothetical protein NVSMB9_31360 [Isosphaeraceae bacterium]